MGFVNYIKNVGIPSVTGYLKDPLPYDYYTAPWEAEADYYGGVIRSDKELDDPWVPQDGYYDLKDLIYELFN